MSLLYYSFVGMVAIYTISRKSPCNDSVFSFFFWVVDCQRRLRLLKCHQFGRKCLESLVSRRYKIGRVKKRSEREKKDERSASSRHGREGYEFFFVTLEGFWLRVDGALDTVVDARVLMDTEGSALPPRCQKRNQLGWTKKKKKTKKKTINLHGASEWLMGQP